MKCWDCTAKKYVDIDLGLSAPDPEQDQGIIPDAEPTTEERLAKLEAQNQMLTQCLMEMSQIVYA